MDEFHFLRPYFFLLTIPVLILICFLSFRHVRPAGPWQNICSKDLLPYILVKKNKSDYFSYLLAALTFLLLITGLSGPAWQRISQPLIKQKSGLVIALDLSPIMDAQDIKPSRLQRAIYKINDILKLHHEGQIALIVFSGNPFVVTPLTDDIATIKNLLPALETKIMPSSGHKVQLAVSKASDLLRQSGINHGSMLLITSELSAQEMDESIAIAKQQGLAVSVLGVGTDEMTPVPQEGGGLLKNSGGSLVMTTLAKTHLNHLAQSTGGSFATIAVDDNDLHQLIPVLYKNRSLSSSAQEETGLKQERWHDQGYLLVLMALPLVSLMFRRGILVVIFFIIPHMAFAFSFNDLWKTKDQQALELFQEGNYVEANNLFQNQEWQAASSYKIGDFENAAELFQNIPTAEGLFNYGTSKAKIGDFDKALEAYNKALELQPEHEDALYNKNVIEEYLKQNKDNKENKNRSNSDKEKKQSQDQNQKEQQDSRNDSQDQNQDQQQDKDKDHKQSEQQNSDNKKENNQQNNVKEPGDEKQGERQRAEDAQDSTGQNEQKKLDETENQELSKQYRENIDKEMQKVSPLENEAINEPLQEMADEEENDPQRQIDKRWLERISDDPAGLLRRKFLQQYRQQQKAK
jgi:Ca-activated chloride channel family protein